MQSNLGGALILAGDLDAAAKVYEKSLQLEQNDEAYPNLGIVYYLRGDYVRSAELHRKAVAASPGSSSSWANLADTLYFAGDTAAAEDAYERAVELAGQDLKVIPRDVYRDLCPGVGAGHARVRQKKRATPLRVCCGWRRAIPIPLLRCADEDPTGRYRGGGLAAEAAMELGYPRSMLEPEPHLAALRRTHEFAEAVNAEAD